MQYYSAIVAVSCLTLIVLSTLVHENEHIDSLTKRRFYTSYSVLFLVTVAEWLALVLNGAPGWTVGIHKIIKCIDYILSPTAGVFFALQIMKKRDVRKQRWIYAILGANTVLEIFSIYSGWTFYVDSDNIYHHGPLYILYTVSFTSAILFVLLVFNRYSKNFKNSNKVSLYSIVFLVCFGVGLQEFVGENIRTSSLSVVIGSVLLYIHYNDFQQQQYDENLARQQHLLETDALTGVYSRYSYTEAVRGFSDEQNATADLAVFSVDINGLKNTNDTLGHDAGDALIRDAAECISRVFGNHGKCYRVGGDEFVAVLTSKNVSVPGLLADLDRAVEKINGSRETKLSLSVGYALSAEHPDYSFQKLVKSADKMMYRNKETHYRALDGVPTV